MVEELDNRLRPHQVASMKTRWGTTKSYFRYVGGGCWTETNATIPIPESVKPSEVYVFLEKRRRELQKEESEKAR